MFEKTEEDFNEYHEFAKARSEYSYSHATGAWFDNNRGDAMYIYQDDDGNIIFDWSVNGNINYEFYYTHGGMKAEEWIDHLMYKNWFTTEMGQFMYPIMLEQYGSIYKEGEKNMMIGLATTGEHRINCLT